ncbi:MAG: hypothetical protein ACU0A6_11450 [Shimia sp.]|jgi:hypothetical protein|uniref:hypothetical protein n=1 Tax=Shimia sp. TaxID=1954381 RepID=UPI0040588845
MNEPFFPSAETSLIVAETRHAVLSQPVANALDTDSQVVLIMPLTASGLARAFANEARLQTAVTEAGHSVATVAWRHHWSTDGKERFAPRLNDLSALVGSIKGFPKKLHVATVGNGALVALKWLSALAKPDAPSLPAVQSLTLISPELSLFDRKPRTSLREVPAACGLVSDETQDWSKSKDLAKRFPHPPFFAVAEDHSRFRLSPEDRTADASIMLESVSLECDWRQSWADWLHRQ